MTTSTSEVPHLRNSERRDFKRCQQRWVWRWRQGLVPKNRKPGALWFGTGIHLALQERYKYTGLRRGENVLKVWRDFCGDEQAVIYGENYEQDRSDFIDGKALGEIMLGGYLDTYGLDPRWHVISAEQTFDLTFPYPRRFSDEGPLVILNGTFDLVARDLEANDSLVLWDHKTAKAIDTKHLALDDQAGTYWAVAGDVLAARGLIGKGEVLDGIVYNFLKKGKPDERPRNADGLVTNKPIKKHYEAALLAHDTLPHGTLAKMEAQAKGLGITVLGDPSKQQPQPLFHREEVWRTRAERRTQIARVQEEALQMRALKLHVLNPTKNPTTDCSWDCDFYQMCLLHEAGDDWKEYRDAVMTTEDPYADHREGAPA